MKTLADMVVALEAAKAAPVGPAKPACGCGRAYVLVSGLERKEVNAFAKAAGQVGLMFLRKAYGTSGNALYVGYDNADGRALAKAAVMADTLKAHGVNAYVDAVAD